MSRRHDQCTKTSTHHRRARGGQTEHDQIEATIADLSVDRHDVYTFGDIHATADRLQLLANLEAKRGAVVGHLTPASFATAASWVPRRCATSTTPTPT